MMLLKDILFHKLKEVEALELLPFQRDREIHNFKESLQSKPIIAEIKKSSPSKGVINQDVDILLQAKKYTRYGAGAISVLTDRKFFSGSFYDLKKIANNFSIPLLCKDFILKEIQIENAYRCGADAVLIVVTVLDDTTLKKLVKKAKSFNLSILFEIHTFDDFERIKKFSPEIIGVNSRNFKNMQIEKDRAVEIIREASKDFFVIAESGINSSNDILMFKNAGASAFLIGTAFMESTDIAKTFKEFYKCL